jgi:glycosyltransferase involved in cell wall biosynthesis
MKFSLILSTKGRTKELIRLFNGFRSQTLQDFEIIVSDQNDDERVSELLKTINWPGKLTYIRSSGGLSGGRNAGLAVAQGEIFGFPDDDCFYSSPTFLEDVAAFFAAHPEYGFLSGRSIADDGGDAASVHAKEPGVIHRNSIYRQCMEFAFFVRREALGNLQFDPKMGVGSGAPWQSDEGPDIMLSMQERGVAGYYDPKFAVWHPKMLMTYDEEMIARCYRYACGSGYFLRKHDYPYWFFFRINAMTFCGAILGLISLKPNMARYYLARLRGRWDGWNGYANEKSVQGGKAADREQ